MKITISEKIIELAGFMLADALWEVFSKDDGDAFEPYAKVIRDGEMQTVQFVAESERFKDAATQALDYLTEHADEFDAWALALDMFTIKLGNKSDLKKMNINELNIRDSDMTDTIQITAWERGMEGPVLIQQPYAPHRSGRFRMLGTPFFVLGNEILGESQTRGYLDPLRSGFMQHSEAAEHSQRWE